MADDSYGVLVEFQAKYDTVTKGFNDIAKGTDKVIANNKKAELSFDDLGRHAHDGANKILNEWLGLGVALSAGGLILFFNRTAEAIDHLTDTARGLGVSAQEFQKLSYGAQLGGVGMDELGDSLKKFNISVGQALQGNEDMIASFKALGVNVEDLRGKDIATQYSTVATSASKLKDTNLAAANAMSVFGRNYVSALSLGRDGIAKNIQEFDQLGVTLTNTQRKAVDAFNDSKTKLDTIFTGFFQKVVADSSPAFKALIDGVSNFIEASGGIDGLATNVANKIVDIVQSTIDVFNALKPGFQSLLTILGTLVDGAKAVFNNAKYIANTFSDNVSQGSTASHNANPGIGDYLYDQFGLGAGGGILQSLDNLIHPYDVAPAAFNNFDPNAVTKNFKGNKQSSINLGSVTNPYDVSANTALAFDKVATSAAKSSSVLNTFNDAIEKSSDSITAGFKAMDDKLKSDELNKIFDIIGQNYPGKDTLTSNPNQTFEKDAADLIQALKNGGLSSSSYNASLNTLRHDVLYNLQSGFSTNGMDQVIAEIEKYAKSLGTSKQQVEVGISVTPTKDFAVKVFTNQDALPYLAASVAGIAADAANNGVNT